MNSKHNEKTIININFIKKMLICVFTGFASGLPLYIILQLMPAWLSSEGISIKTIGIFTLTQVPYVWKFIWAPIMDNLSPFKLGRRKGWMLLTQLFLVAIIGSMGLFTPQLDIMVIASLSLAIAFFSATQDVALDAFRRELLTDQELGLGNSIHINAYRISGLVPGSLSLILSDYLPWDTVFIITASFMAPVIIITLLVKEPNNRRPVSCTIQEMITKPFYEFIHRNGLKSALLILAFIFLYKLGDSMATALATPFYLEMGYSKVELGLIAKNAGLWPSVFGALAGGILMLEMGINRALWLFGMVQLLSILGFAWLSIEGPFAQVDSYQRILLAFVIGFEALGVGLGTAGFVSFIARTTNPLYTATQFALFTSFASIPRTLVNASTGFIVNSFGWTNFFYFCTIMAIPGMLLLFYVAPWREK